MRASRLLSLLLLLQNRGQLTARQLADELEVSIRTIYRDVEALSASGVPVYGEGGPSGGYQLVAGYRTRLTGLTGGEAESLFLSAVPAAAAELGLGTMLAAAELKLLAALPAALRDRAGHVRQRFHLDVPGWFREADPTPHLAAVADAVWNQRRIRVDYQRWAGPTTRTLEPLGVVLKAGLWYVVARSAGQLRTYKVAQIVALEPLDEPFDRPPDFDLPTFWAAWARRYEKSVHVATAVVRLAPAAVERLPGVLGRAVADAVQRTSIGPDEVGWVTATIPVEKTEVAHRDLLKLGADVEVLEPPELRALMTETASRFAAAYLA
ncbi:YafY family protein [Fodinicola feengrottensis]|uniref:YafY family protein n=1 Tax=Fodinicola feengrottensis TaxID=435914 RepID=A0ABP4T528_9ACTN